MPSPFPGMDPYIEASGLWGDFHMGMLGAIRAQLNARLPEGFAAAFEVYVWVHEPEATRRKVAEPDVYVIEREGRGKTGTARPPALDAPATIVLPTVERRKHKFIQIIDQASRRVVTAIELLSPTNKKAGPDREMFLNKRAEYFANRINVVEIDLLRGGRRLPLGHPPPRLQDYYVMVCRSWEFPRASLWPFTMREPVPEIPIPLTPEVADVVLPLRPCVDRAYDEGRYATELDYHSPISPRLPEGTAGWVDGILKKRRTRHRAD